MFDLETVVVTPFQQNCRLIIDRESKEAVIIDPGGEGERLFGILGKEGLTLKEIWLTHSHLDHCGGVQSLKRLSGCKLIGHKVESEMRVRVPEICQMYGLPAGDMEACPEPDQYLEGGEVIQFGGYKFEVLFTPGHSPGHLCFYYKEGDILIAGDTLFSGSIGRTDLPGGNHQELLDSISQKILPLPDQTQVLSGHGPDTTVGRERSGNPFLI